MSEMRLPYTAQFDRTADSKVTLARVQEPLVDALKTSATTGHLQYLGFRHAGNRREYRYQRLVSGQPTEHFAIWAELGLLTSKGIALQAGPSICGHVLAEKLKDPNGSFHLERGGTLTEQDLMEYAIAHPAEIPTGRKGQHRRTEPDSGPTASG